MVLTPKLELRQGQQLVMTPQLQQAIRLLQLSNLELGVFVENELERNPLLEHDEAVREGPQGDDKQRHKAAAGDDGKAGARNELPSQGRGDRVGLNGEMGDRGGWASLRPSTHNGDVSDDPNLEEFVAASRSLADHLTEQLHLMVPDPAERLIGAHLIHMVDESGYLLGSLDDSAARLGAPHALVAKVLTTLQGFDPPGVFARDLAECLALQLKDANRYDPQIAKLLDNLALLGSHNLGALRRAVGVDNDELVEMVAEIKTLNPKPGLKLGSIQIQPILPDVLVRPAPDGSWLVELNSETLPRVLVNRSYYTNVAKTARSEQDKGYLLDCLQSANWLVKSLDQRARTILRVAEEIVRQQDGFLEHGVEHLKPLNLRTVADAIKMHEFDRQPCHLEQVHVDPARHLRAQVLLHLRDLGGQRHRRVALFRIGPAPHPPADRGGDAPVRPLGRQAGRIPEARRHRHRAPHGGQVPRGTAHPLLRAAPARQADGGAPEAGLRPRAPIVRIAIVLPSVDPRIQPTLDTRSLGLLALSMLQILVAAVGGERMLPYLCRLVVLCCTLAVLHIPAAEARRVALVIGNAAYKIGPLTNPINDATES